MKMKKIYIILIIILVVFFLVMFFVFGLDNIKKNKYDTTLIVGNDIVWNYNRQKWTNVNSMNNLNWKKYNVYLDNVEKGKYYLLYNDKWYAFDNKKNAVRLDGQLIAYKANYDISIYNFNVENIDDFSYVYDVLEDKSLSTSSQYTVSNKVVIDYDNDGEDETFYLVSNAFPIGFSPDKIFSLVFMVKNDEIYPIYTNITNNTGYNGCKPYFRAFVDVDNDSKYEFILSCAKYSASGTTNMLYEFKDKEFKILISNN